MTSIWVYPTPIGQRDLIGYEAEATDGRIGKIDESSNEIGSAYVVVDTGSPRMMWQLAGRCRRVRSAPVNVMEGRGQ